MLHADVALLDVVIDLFIHVGQSTLEQASVPVVLDAERLDLLPLQVLELFKFIALNLLLVEDLLDLAYLLLEGRNVCFLGDERSPEVTDSLLVQFERVVLREQLIVHGVDQVFCAHLLCLGLFVVLLQLANHTTQFVVLHAQDCHFLLVVYELLALVLQSELCLFLFLLKSLNLRFHVVQAEFILHS